MSRARWSLLLTGAIVCVAVFAVVRSPARRSTVISPLDISSDDTAGYTGEGKAGQKQATAPGAAEDRLTDNSISQSSSPAPGGVVPTPPPRRVYKPHRSTHLAGIDVTPLRQIANGKSFLPKMPHYGWVFKEYISSRFEAAFYREVGPLEGTEWLLPMRDKFRTEFDKLLRDMAPRVLPHQPVKRTRELVRQCAEYLNKTVEGKPISPTQSCLSSTEPMDEDIFSRFVYEFRCIDPPCSEDPPETPAVGDLHVSYIEPLVGILRHPECFVKNSVEMKLKLHRGYMIIDKWALNNLFTRYRERERHSTYVDLGASVYRAQSWFIGLGDCMCIPYETLRLWEWTQHTPMNYWEEIPERLHPNYVFYNYPLSSDIDSFANPLNHVVSKVRYGDPLVLKVDFDSAAMEIEIIRTLTATPDIYRRVDELFFEHHANIPLMVGAGWGKHSNLTCHFRCSADVFLDMRRRGIRAHSWI